jgi:hypothetical protein
MTVIPVCQCRSKRCGHALDVCTRVANVEDGLCGECREASLSAMFEAVRSDPTWENAGH